MNKPFANRWTGRSADEVLVESYHELREPVYNAVGFLSVLQSVDQLSAKEIQQYIDSALRYVLSARDVIDSVYQYMNEKSAGQ